jgi:FHS family glucose/mannose:H+ symporter-like MFS transporter
MKNSISNRISTIVCFLILIVFAMSLTIISPLLESIRKTYSLSISESGLIFTANFMGFVAFVLLGGMLADRHGKKTVLLCAMAGFTLLLFVFPFSPSFLVLCINMFFIGGFGGIIESMTMAMVSDLNIDNPVFYVNLSQVFFGIGAVVGPILAGFAVSSGLSWQRCYIPLSFLALALTVLLAACKVHKVVTKNGLSLSGVKYCFKDMKFLLVCLCMVLYTGSEVGGWGWLCTLLKQKFDFGVSEASISVAVFWIAMTAGRLFCGPLTSRFKLRNIIIFLSFCSAVVTALSILISSKDVIWFVIAAMGLTYSSQYPFLVSFGSSQTKTATGSTFAILMGFGGVGSMIVPYLMGLIGSMATLSMAMILPAALLCVIGIIFTTEERQEQTA